MTKLKDLLLEAIDPEKVIKYADEDGKSHDVKLKTALSYKHDHPAYKAARAVVGKDGDSEDGGEKKQQPQAGGESPDASGNDAKAPKKDADKTSDKPEKSAEPKGAAMFKHDAEKKDAGHGSDAHSSDAHGGHGPSNLSKLERNILAAADVVVKVTHIPVIQHAAGQLESIYSKSKEVVQTAEQADGFLGKAKCISKAAGSVIAKAGEKFKTDFVNSLHDENTGARKSVGAIVKDKGMAVVTGIIGGLKKEAQHIGHGLADGANGLVSTGKKILNGEKLDSSDKEKLTSGLRAAATCCVIGLAIATGPMGMLMKGGSLAINPGHVLKHVLSDSIFNRLYSQGKISLIKESMTEKQAVKYLNELVESSIDNLTPEDCIKAMMIGGGNELQTVDKPFEKYGEDEMNEVVKWSVYSDQMSSQFNKAKTKSGEESKNV